MTKIAGSFLVGDAVVDTNTKQAGVLASISPFGGNATMRVRAQGMEVVVPASWYHMRHAQWSEMRDAGFRPEQYAYPPKWPVGWSV